MARLAIMDPSPRAQQPMSRERCHLVYNGEIFNFRQLRSVLAGHGARFSTTGDTEVLLQALLWWRGDACGRLEGMFAFAMWDEQRHQLWMARDSFGIKPLYWRALPAGGVAVASEARPLAAIGDRRIEPGAIYEFLRFGSPVTVSAYENVVEVEPGTLTVWSADGTCRTEHFDASPRAAGDAASSLGSAVAAQLSSDRPVSIYLSGGFDSAAVAAAAQRAGSRPVALTLATPTNGPDVERAAATAAIYGLEHRVVPVGGIELPALTRGYLDAMDQPTIDGFNTYLISRAASGAGFPVALTGIGGDEVLGGYGYHRLHRKAMVAHAAARRLPRGLREVGTRLVAAAIDRSRDAVGAILEAGSEPARHQAFRSLFSEQDASRLTGTPPPPSLRWVTDPGADYRDQLLQLDYSTYLRPTLLRDTDIFSMAHGVEVRVPLLDDSFVASARSSPFPPSKCQLARAWGDGHLLVVASQRKLTFSMPWRLWLAPLLASHQELLGSDDPWAGLVDVSEARKLMAADTQRASTSPLRAFALLVLAHWANRGVQAPRRLERSA